MGDISDKVEIVSKYVDPTLNKVPYGSILPDDADVDAEATFGRESYEQVTAASVDAVPSVWTHGGQK